MTNARRLALLMVLLSGGISVLWGCALGRAIPGGPVDFQAIYYGSRTLIQHHNPYVVSEVEGVYQAEGGERSPLPDALRRYHCVTLYVNLPPTLLVVAPFAMLPLGIAQVLWMILTASSLILAAFLAWDLAANDAPILSAFLIGFLLANCQILFGTGNTAGIVVGLCVTASWCFLRDRFVPAGILCMAVSLSIKPHDAGLVWLFFLLAGGATRKRALQSAVLVAALALPAILWVSQVAPHWIHDWQTNMTAISAPGGLNDPRPASVTNNSAGSVISLQAVFSIFRDDPRFYNSASYLVCGTLLLVWVFTTLRSRSSRDSAWLALAAIVPLTILVTYHRVYDAKLLLLTVPACALLWAGGGPTRWIACALNAAGVVLNGDITLAILELFTKQLHLSTAALSGQILTVVLARPNQEILLAMSVFYLWIYARRASFNPVSAKSGWFWRGTQRTSDSLNRPTAENLVQE